jgi:hypothetical protein
METERVTSNTNRLDGAMMTDKIKYFLEAWAMNGVGETIAKVQDSPGSFVTITTDDLSALLSASKPAAPMSNEQLIARLRQAGFNVGSGAHPDVWANELATDGEYDALNLFRKLLAASPAAPSADTQDDSLVVCSEERPCISCFTDNGPCESPNLQDLVVQADMQIGDGHIERARETLQRVIETLHSVAQKHIDAIDRTTSTSANVAPAATVQPDDLAVDQFAAAMKEKLAQAREKGRGGWQHCDPAKLSNMLREHVEKGDPRDVANFCMFLWCLGQPISGVASTSTTPDIEAAMKAALGQKYCPPLTDKPRYDWLSPTSADRADLEADDAAPQPSQPAQSGGPVEVLDWLETEVTAISCRYHGDPSYDHDAYWMRDRVVKLTADARKAFAPPQSSQPVEAGEAETDGDLVLVERGLLGAACAIIRKQKPESKVLEKLRAITMASSAPSAVVLDDARASVGDVYVKLIRPSTGDVFKALRTDSCGIAELLKEGWEIACVASPQATATQPAQTEQALTVQLRAAYAALDAVADWAKQEGATEEGESGTRLLGLLLKHGVHPRESTAAQPASGGDRD